MANERKAIEALDSLDKNKYAVIRSVREIIHIIHDCIPRSCIREAEDKLFDAFFINGVELTSSDMRKEYERWKKIEIEKISLAPFFVIKP